MSLLSQIGMSGVRASQIALNVSGQNVANASTPGYTRIGAEMASVGGHNGMSSGSGVQVSNIRRIGDDFLTRQLWRATTAEAASKATQHYLSALETLMSSDGSNVGTGLDNFFAALSEAGATPDSTALRQQILSEAGNLAQRFNGLNSNIEAQLGALREQRTSIVGELNGLTANIAKLNKQITAAESGNADSKALRDQRDSLVQTLSGYADIRVQEAADGGISVSLANGQPLVAGPTAATVSLTTVGNNEQDFSLQFAGTSFPLARDGWGGQLGALYDSEYNALRSTRATLGEMAKGVADLVNGVLTGADPTKPAYDLNGNPGKSLFVYDPTSISQMLTVTNLTPEELAFSSANDEVGNNDRLLDLLALKNVAVSVGGSNVTLNDAYATLLGRVASDSRQSQSDLDTATSVLEQAQAQRNEVSAVSLDEEAVNLMNYQQAYQANLKVINTANELFDSVLTLL